MKNILILTVLTAFLTISCQEKSKEKSLDVPSEEMAYNSYGEEFMNKNALSSEEIEAQFQNLKPGDSLDVVFTSNVNEVCKSKGCWMQLDLPTEEDVMVKFKDYGFFVPKDIANKEVVVKGKAYVTEVPVEEQRHYAEDNGKTEEEIAAITEPKRTLSFLAEGVLIKKEQ